MQGERKTQNGAGILGGEGDRKLEVSEVCSALLVSALQTGGRGWSMAAPVSQAAGWTPQCLSSLQGQLLEI